VSFCTRKSFDEQKVSEDIVLVVKFSVCEKLLVSFALEIWEWKLCVRLAFGLIASIFVVKISFLFKEFVCVDVDLWYWTLWDMMSFFRIDGVRMELDKLDEIDDESLAADDDEDDDDDVEDEEECVEDEWRLFSLVSTWFFKMISGDGDEGNDVSKFVFGIEPTSGASKSIVYCLLRGELICSFVKFVLSWRGAVVGCEMFNGADDVFKI